MSATQHLPTTFATLVEAQAIIKRLYPTAQNIVHINHGYDNLVLLVDETYALRFPRDKAAWLRSQYEKSVLNDLAHHDLGGIVIPTVLDAQNDPPYLITTFLFGKHMSAVEAAQLPIDLQKELGKKVAAFAFGMHKALSVEKAFRLRKAYDLDEQQEEPWDIYFKRLLIDTKLPTEEQDRTAKEYYERWQSIEPSGQFVVIHDDLHTDNMLFEQNHLTGVLDFGDTNIGTPEQELRQLYRINDVVLDTAVATYERLSGQRLNKEALKLWAIVQELAAYSDRLKLGKTEHPAFTRSARNLNRWFETDIWGGEHSEGIDI